MTSNLAPSHAAAPLTLALAALALSLAGCSSSTSSPDGETAADGGGGPGEAPATAKQSGRIVKALSQNAPLAGATVSVANGASAVTGPDGTYELLVPRGKPFTMTVSAEGHFGLREQELTVNGDTFARGNTNRLPKDLANALASLLPGRDPQKGLLIVEIATMAPCASAEGTTLELSPPGASQRRYFSGGFPAPSATAVKAGESFAAIFYNIDPGVPVKVEARSPTCGTLPFPVAHDGVTYSAAQAADPGDQLTVLRAFLGGP